MFLFQRVTTEAQNADVDIDMSKPSNFTGNILVTGAEDMVSRDCQRYAHDCLMTGIGFFMNAVAIDVKSGFFRLKLISWMTFQIQFNSFSYW